MSCAPTLVPLDTWQAVGWIVGFVMGDFTYTLIGWAAGMLLSIIVSAWVGQKLNMVPYCFIYYGIMNRNTRQGEVVRGPE